MHPTLAADTAADAGGVIAVLEVVRDGLTMTGLGYGAGFKNERH
jgi:hypothetical protein